MRTASAIDLDAVVYPDVAAAQAGYVDWRRARITGYVAANWDTKLDGRPALHAGEFRLMWRTEMQDGDVIAQSLLVARYGRAVILWKAYVVDDDYWKRTRSVDLLQVLDTHVQAALAGK